MATQSTQYSWITWLQAQQELALRLSDPTNVFWTVAENKLYLQEALSVWNVLTQWWPQDFTFTINPPTASDWTFTNTAGTPREQTLLDGDLYSLLLYHILEPQLISGAWAGTDQFSLNDLAQSVTRTRNEILQGTACKMEVLDVLGPVPNSSRIFLPDDVLDVRRVRYAGVDGTTLTPMRGDSLSFLRFSPDYRQTSDTPRRWDVLGSPPLALTFDTLVNQPSNLEILAMQAASELAPPDTTPLQIPNDWMWVLKYGALQNLFNNEAEATDRQRASYCKKRYEEGLKLMQVMPWLMNGFINEVACDITAVVTKDRNSYEWQLNPVARPTIVIGGIDLVALCPTVQPLDPPAAVKLTVVGNAPQPVADGDFVQVPRDVMDSIMDYAQHLAAFKQGGDEFFETMPLYQNFIRYAVETSLRLRKSGIFESDLRPEVSKQDLAEPRFAEK